MLKNSKLLAVITMLIISAGCSKKNTNARVQDPCMEAVRLRKEAASTSSEQRGILEAKAAAMQDICNGHRKKNADDHDESQRRLNEVKQNKKAK